MRPTIRLVPDFIIPNLNQATYRDHLLWEDEKNGIFKISRIHQSSDMWSEQCIEVYKAWSLQKNLWNARDPKRISKAKHRLITALRRNPEVEMLRKVSTFYRFRLINPDISDVRSYQENQNPTRNDFALPRRNKTEAVNSIEYREAAETNVMKNVLEVKKETKDRTIPHSCETNSSFSFLSYSLEVNDSEKLFSLPEDDCLVDLYPSDSKSAIFSDKCCCEKLLDTYLCDQKCIWHGMPP